MTDLIFTTCQAPNAAFVGEFLADYAGRKLGLKTAFVADMPWDERERRLLAGDIHVGWICGLPYVWYADQPSSPLALLALLAAAVPSPPRYQNRPIYFSDVIVRADSPAQTVADLRGAVWAYNEPRSHSGHAITRYQLAKMGETAAFFGQIVAAGSHENALRLLLNGAIDATAVDSTVLETELARRPALAAQIRVLASWGPSPIPPWVVHKGVPAARRQALRALFLELHTDPVAEGMLARARYRRFTAVADADYDPIRRMDQAAQGITL